LEPATVVAAVADYYGVPLQSYRQRRSRDSSRDLAAWLARTMTAATMRELMDLFGLSHPDSVSNLVRRAERDIAASKQLTKDIDALKQRLTKTENRV
jgi:chromosomal replication initiation ATPase DnaA